MPDNGELNHLEEAEKKLYRRDIEPEAIPRTELRQRAEHTKKDWALPRAPLGATAAMSNSFLAKLLIFAIIFFIGTLGIAGFVLWQGSNQISGSNIDFEIKGPVAVRAGDETALQVLVANRNASELQNVKLIIEFPADTKLASSTMAALPRQTQDLGTIDSGSLVSRTVRAVYFGGEKEEKTVLAKIEYRVPGSNALYTKETAINFSISAPPVTMTIDLPTEAAAGEEVAMKISLTPKALDLAADTLVVVDYPTSFNYLGADKEPTYRNNVWLLSEATVGEEVSFTITGTIDGFPNDRKSFKVSIGSQDPVGEDTIAFVYNEAFKTITLKEPFVSVALKVNGEVSAAPIVEGGEMVRIDIEWANNLSSEVTDASIDLRLTGAAIDKARVTAGSGFYQASRDTISWSKNSDPKLSSIKAGEKDTTSFSFYTKPLSAAELAAVRDPLVNLELVFSGTRISEGFAGEKITTTVAKTIRLKSLVQFSSRSLYRSGLFQNTGPLPPKVGGETTYTVVWSVLNSSNTLRDAVVKTTLPPSVFWLNAKKPESEDLAFNPTSRELVWDIGRLAPGVTPREISFQLSLKPELSQAGKALPLVGPTVFKAFDTFTETVVQESDNGVGTNLTTDSGYNIFESQVAS